MKKRKLIYALASALILIALIISILRQGKEENEPVTAPEDGIRNEDQSTTTGSLPAPSGESETGSRDIDDVHREEVQMGLEAIFEGLKTMGAKEVPPVADALRQAIASEDPGAIRRAFNEATYGRFAKMSESIPAMKAYLDSSEPYVRYLAAEALLRIGNRSGIETLIKLIQSDEPVYQDDRDLRFSAAEKLANFNVSIAAETIRDLYSRTKEGKLLQPLASLGVKAQEADSWKYVPSSLAIENYAKEGSMRFVPEIKETFNDPKVPEIYREKTKTAAAWALARMTGEEEYLNYLSQAARSAIESKSEVGLTYDGSTEALKYLGSIASPKAVRVLETALESENPVAVQYATVNLLFNQSGGSEKAEQFVLKELRTTPKMLNVDLAMKLASRSDNSEIREAAESYAQRTGSDRWRYWGKERSDWPIENWVYDYVVTLNR